ncbi:serine/threonine protein kinase [Oxynema aestuarii]|jgi:serine/threonine protein kinase|uniref:non-specific serine/threonine protein kinase n=1 Tax=Oxynema aestuarii AP17 TaxID=2064643 RepID=A0A6H1U244_9CYAN|nr:serine/threonine-protein kinase [Oxynema aestuarii]QIZ72516.1 serine/threonine protein kinase [Oxynema aestuarii AP17]
MQRFVSIPVVGNLLADRYQVIEVLDADAFGKTYIAEDTHSLGQHKCFVKQLSLALERANCPNFTRHLLTIEAQTLEQLGHHEQIPQLIDCFEYEQELFLVQEYIEGETLSNQLPTGKHGTWAPEECLTMLQDVLGVLDFIHDRGLIHCAIAPENLIRRQSDGKWMLLNFGAIRGIQNAPVTKPGQFVITVPLGTFGYLPPEQLTGHPQPNSDIYALGLIAIQALTGLHPSQIEIEPTRGELRWQHAVRGDIEPKAIAVLAKMVSNHAKQRYQSASEVLKALQLPHAVANPTLSVVGTAIEESDESERSRPLNRNSEESTEVTPQAASEDAARPSRENSTPKPAFSGFKSNRPMPSLFVVSIWAAIALNALVITGGLTALLHLSATDDGNEVLARARQEYHAGDFEDAIALAESIPTFSSAYYNAQSELEQWQVDWQNAARQYAIAEKAFQEQRWLDTIRAAQTIPEIIFWQEKSAPLVTQATAAVAGQTPQWLQEAYDRASERDFAAALKLLQQIPPGTPVYDTAQAKIAEYGEKERIKLKAEAHQLIQKAYQRAQVRDFEGAIQLLEQIPEAAPTYALVRQKIAEYREKQQIKGNRLLQSAYNRAKVKDYAGALQYLKKIPEHTAAYDTARVKRVEYTRLRRQKRKRTSTAILDPSFRESRPSVAFNPGEQLQEIDLSTPIA